MTSSMIPPLLIALALGYALGSIPFGLILTQFAGLGDVRAIGSGNIGATNVLRTGNKKLAALTLLLDMLKGTAAVLLAMVLARWLITTLGGGRDSVLLFFLIPWMAGLGAILGHMFPVWLGFKGGKGVATYIGVLVGTFWPAAMIFCISWLVVAAVSRYSSLASLAATFFTFVHFMIIGGNLVIPIVAIISALIYWKHRENIRRLVAGEESRIRAKIF